MGTLAATQRQARKQLSASAPRSSGGSSRFVVLAFLLLCTVAAAGLFLLGAGLVDGSVLGLGALDDFIDGDEAGLRRIGVTAGALGVGILSLALLLRRPSSRSVGTASRHIVEMTDRGIVYVNSASVSVMASSAVRRVPGVLSAEVRVRGSGASPVRLHVRAAVIPGTALPKTGELAQEAARDAAERLAGLQVLDVAVEMLVAVPDDIDRFLE